MAQFPILRLTHAGHEMAGMSQGGGKLTFVRVELGDGQLKEEDSIEALTGLKRSVMQLPLQGYLNEGNGKARLRFVIDNSALTVGFHNREVGIFAKIDNGAERLYAYTNAGNYADWIPSKETPIDGDIVDLHIVIGNAANVTIQTVSGAYATKIDLEEHRTAPELDHPENSVHKKHLHQDAYESPALTGTPTAPTAGRGTNNTQIASTAFVAQAIAALVNSAPGALDTLQELAQALGNDANFAATVTNALADKVSKAGDVIRGRIFFENTSETKGSVFPAAVLHHVQARDYPATILTAYPDENFLQRTTFFAMRVSVGDGTYKEHQLHVDGWHCDLHGTADRALNADSATYAGNAGHLEGNTLGQILEQINAAKTGIVASNLAPNGWVKFANGLIVQWGTGPSKGWGEEDTPISFPITFPTAVFVVLVSTDCNGDKHYEADIMWQVRSRSNAGAVLYNQRFTAMGNIITPEYIAIGM